MPSIYKYFSNQEYLESFLKHGETMFHSLAYFRDYEEDQIRGDEYEGTLQYRPKEGLKITTNTEKQITLPSAFESRVNEQDIYVFCLSTELSLQQMKEFKAIGCVEICHPIKFIAKIKSAIKLRSKIKDKTIIHGSVNYHSADEPLGADWALPEKIIMKKPQKYRKQKEYRIAFSTNESLNVYNTSTRIVGENRRLPRDQKHSSQILRVGNLSKIIRIHYIKDL